jgi:hypothetical protein
LVHFYEANSSTSRIFQTNSKQKNMDFGTPRIPNRLVQIQKRQNRNKKLKGRQTEQQKKRRGLLVSGNPIERGESRSTREIANQRRKSINTDSRAQAPSRFRRRRHSLHSERAAA